MPAATNQQMQTYADERIRTFAEAARLLLAQARDHKAAIDDAYARASGGAAWNDNRSDGPPHLLQAGAGANPDDVLNFNAFVTAFLAFFDGSGNVAGQAASWAVLQRACVRPLTLLDG